MNKKEKFFELRIEGKSFDSIARTINVSKPTLIKWSKALHKELENQKVIEWEAFLERLQLRRQQRIVSLKNISDQLTAEFSKRNLNEVPTPKLLDFILRIQTRLDDLNDKAVLSSDTDNDLLGPNKWEA